MADEQMKKFKDGAVGRLMWAEPNPNTRFEYDIWFDYTRKLINDIQEGELIAVPNFTNDITTRWSVLQLTNVMPTHYALGSDKGDLKGFPGFVMQAAKSASSDWTEQESESFEDTTKICCKAVPVNLEFKDNDLSILHESTMPMIGKDAKLLSSGMTEKIYNRGLKKDNNNIIDVGHLLRDDKVEILIRVEDLVKTHFGIFGFTGVGKSNILSTMVYKLLNSDRIVKIVLFDLMDEYTGLLIDQILNEKINAKIICLGEKTLTNVIFDYLIKPNKESEKKVVDSYLEYLLLPKGLKTNKEIFKPAIKKLLDSNKIKIYGENIRKTTVGEFYDNSIYDEIFDEYVKGNLKARLETVINLIMDKYGKEELTSEIATKILRELSEVTKLTDVSSATLLYAEDTFQKRLGTFVYQFERVIQLQKNKKDNLKSIEITLSDIINDLNKTDKSSLYIILSHNDREIRKFSNELGYWFYERRRREGRISPLSLFLFDEADTFIPSQISDPSQNLSKQIIETLSRRGRKFGIGVGIATQRSSYLETNIMGQLHTYFISKLPREYDRKVVGEAFSLSPDQFTQTFKFIPGQWLLVSHDATGLNMPIPIKTSNAEDRIKEFLSSFST